MNYIPLYTSFNYSEDNYLKISKNLLIWYDSHRRSLPWRARVGEIPNPYHVLLSEIMLQQTIVATVINKHYYIDNIR